jgi:hypothetical protein
MTEKETLQSAGDEARKAATSAQECADILDEYAASLSDPAFMSRAFELRKMLHDKLAEITLAVHASDLWRLGR